VSTQNGAPAGIAVANAPVSYGAFEITVGHDPNVPDGISVLDQVAAAGYAGIDLGPVGYLGSGTRLGELLAERNLGLAGGYLELPYADHDALGQALGDLDALLDTFDAVRSYLPGPPPRPTLADAGSPQRRSQPGRSAGQPSLGLDAGAWRRFAEGLARVVGRSLGVRHEPAGLRRARATAPQAGLGRRARQANLRGAFACRRSFQGLHVAIVDDVMTTGATAHTLARVLKAAGAARVSAWTVARAPDVPRR